MQQKIEAFNVQLAHAGTMELIRFFLEEYKGRIALSSSLGLEDQVLTQMVCSVDKNIRIFTLDTGRLFPETYDLIDRKSVV
jgi:phosphoadenosine phosphosulfate reductase